MIKVLIGQVGRLNGSRNAVRSFAGLSPLPRAWFTFTAGQPHEEAAFSHFLPLLPGHLVPPALVQATHGPSL